MKKCTHCDLLNPNSAVECEKCCKAFPPQNYIGNKEKSFTKLSRNSENIVNDDSRNAPQHKTNFITPTLININAFFALIGLFWGAYLFAATEKYLELSLLVVFGLISIVVVWETSQIVFMTFAKVENLEQTNKEILAKLKEGS